MAKRPDARALLFERIRTSPPKFVHIRGVPYTVVAEETEDPLAADHLYLNVEVPPFGRLRVCLNTLSRLNRDAGFDGRARVGIIKSTFTEKPALALEECPGLDYAKQDEKFHLQYEHIDHKTFTESFAAKFKAAVRAEIWGELYATDHLGLHQIHSRRASSAVAQDVKNRDGAIKLYYPDNTTEAFLFKFDGQP